jgi:hypothetical protein
MVFVSPEPKKLRLLIGKPIFPSSIEGIGEIKEAYAVVAIAKKTRQTMQNMMDDYYGGLENEN